MEFPSTMPLPLIGMTCDVANPKIKMGMVNTKPAIGPAAPTSNNCRRLRIGPRKIIAAPNVPNGPMNGKGKK